MKKIFFLILLLVTSKVFSGEVNQEWLKSYSSLDIGDSDVYIQNDSEGFIYIAYSYLHNQVDYDWKLTKLKPNKDTLFTISFYNPFGNDFVKNLIIDKNDNIYIIGNLTDALDTTNIGVYKINQSGSIVWQYRSNSIAGNCSAHYITLDDSGNVYLGVNSTIDTESKAFILKLNSSGIMQWSFYLDNSETDIIQGLKLNSLSNLIAVCNVLNADWDIKLLSLSTNGDFLYEQDFNGEGDSDDECKDFTIDLSNNFIYITGYSIQTNNKDFVTISYESDGSLRWYAYFDEYSMDDVAISIQVTSDHLIVVGGNCLTDESGPTNMDIVTILYDEEGLQLWKQKFEGDGLGDDLLSKIILNSQNSELILFASVWDQESNYNVCLINYSIEGEPRWTIFYNDSINKNNLAKNISIDFLGNIYVTVLLSDSINSEFEVIKYNQPDKFIPVLKNFLQELSIGLLDASTNQLVKDFIYEHCATSVDSFYYISYSELIDSCTANGLDLKQVINDEISSFFSFPQIDYVDYIFKRYWIMGNLFKPLIAVPHYHHFTQIQLEDDPKIAFSYDDRDYPVSCLNCSGGTIDKALTESNVTWLSLIIPLPYYHINGNPTGYITACTADQPDYIGDRCRVCPPSSPDQLQAGASGATQNHEFELKIGSEGNIVDPDICFSSLDIQTFPSYYPNAPFPVWARISKWGDLPYFAWYMIGLPQGEARIYKVPHPFYDRLFWSFSTGNYNILNTPNWLAGDILSICYTQTLFDNSVTNQDIGFRYAIAHGLYRIDRPGSPQKPVYFYLPYLKGLWYTQGPDLGIFYGTIQEPNCVTGEVDIIEDYYTEQCEFCSYGPTQVPISTNDIRKYIATTDLTTIYNYWSQRVISVGIRNSLSGGPAGSSTPGTNIHDFTQNNSCTPTGTLIGSLTLLSNGEYQITKNLTQNLNPNDVVTIHVRANYEWGYSINECKTVTIMNNGSPSSFFNILVNIRGNIKSYSSSSNNYQIDIYQ